MKTTSLSTCEKNFITQSIKLNKRLDGRKNDEFRPLKISYGTQWGSVLVILGETKVLAQISAELGEPKATRPNEGILFINVEIGPMAASNFEAGRNCEITVQINRILERTFKDSHFIDLESLCIISEECVWTLRADLNVLNHDGNLIDCCSIATLCAFAHFRRLDVSVVENKPHVHSIEEREPLSMVLHHYPVCVSYVIFNEGSIAVADPTYVEERTADSQVIFGINSHKELCSLNFGGSSLTSSELLLQSSSRAAKRAKLVVNLIKRSLDQDSSERLIKKNVGFVQYLSNLGSSLTLGSHLVLKLRDFTFQDIYNDPGGDSTAKTFIEENKKEHEYADFVKEHDSKLSKLSVNWLYPDSVSKTASAAFVDLQAFANETCTRKTEKAIFPKLNSRKNHPDDKNRKSKKRSIRKEISSSDSEEDMKIIL